MSRRGHAAALEIMSHLLRFSRLLPLALLAAAPAFAAVACNAQVATVLNSDAEAPEASTTTPDGGGGDGGGACCPRDPAPSGCMNLGGSSKDGCSKTCDFFCSENWRVEKDDAGCEVWRYDTRAPKPGETSTCQQQPPVGPVCYSDKDCNSDPSVSALWGRCFYGVCTCTKGYSVQANGKCAATPPPDCPAQSGTCRQQPATCHSDELVVGTPAGDMSCGDVVPAVCCQKTSACKGPAREIPGGGYSPVDMVCCTSSGTAQPPICVNGFETCDAGTTAVINNGGSPCGV